MDLKLCKVDRNLAELQAWSASNWLFIHPIFCSLTPSLEWESKKHGIDLQGNKDPNIYKLDYTQLYYNTTIYSKKLHGLTCDKFNQEQLLLL